MKWIIRAVFVILALVGLGMIAGRFMPSALHIERSIKIDAAVHDVFPYLENLETMQSWSPWTAMDPSAQFVFTGPSGGVGQAMAWQSDLAQIGLGTQTITESDAASFTRTALNFGGRTATGTYAVQPHPNEDGVYALIAIDTDMGGFPYFQRLFSSRLDRRIGDDFERALENLKTLVERDLAAAAPQ